MRVVLGAVLAALIAAGTAAADVRQAPLPGSLEPDAIAVLDLPGTVEAMSADKHALIYYLSELHRRFPDDVEAPDMTGVPPIDAESARLLAEASDDALIATVERVSAEVEALIAHGEGLASRDAPAAVAPITPAAQAAVVPPAEKPWCEQMYGKAYMLCASDDRGCKMIAANDWGICKKTGRWP